MHFSLLGKISTRHRKFQQDIKRVSQLSLYKASQVKVQIPLK